MAIFNCYVSLPEGKFGEVPGLWLRRNVVQLDGLVERTDPQKPSKTLMALEAPKNGPQKMKHVPHMALGKFKHQLNSIPGLSLELVKMETSLFPLRKGWPPAIAGDTCSRRFRMIPPICRIDLPKSPMQNADQPLTRPPSQMTSTSRSCRRSILKRILCH